MNILINSTVLSNFAVVDRLGLLSTLYNTLLVAHAVYEEIERGVEEGYTFLAEIEAHIYPFHPSGWLHLITLEGETELALYKNIPPKLHRGEAESLAIAAHRGYQFLTDDRAARQQAARMGVSVGGTLGVLVQLVRREHLSLQEANGLLSQMIAQANYRSPVIDLGLLIE